jgi:hypothetical protein
VNCLLFADGSAFLQVVPADLAGPETVTLAEADGSSNLTAFVIMPFVERDAKHSTGFFAEVLRSIITPAAKASQFTVRTANRQGSDLIQSTIINDLMEADLVIADLTEHNPNVMFELGMRMAEDKPAHDELPYRSKPISPSEIDELSKKIKTLVLELLDLSKSITDARFALPS